MFRKVSVSLILLILPVYLFSQAGTSTVRGVCSDLNGVPIPNLTVFVPFTSIGTTTDSKGEFILRLDLKGNIELVFRHVAYKPVSKKLIIVPGEKLNLDLVFDSGTIEISEVIKRADQKFWDMGYTRFKKFVLGDEKGNNCRIKNPEDLYFYYVDNELIGHAVKPLIIENRYLGYDIKYFLDYFRFIETKKNGEWDGGGQFAFSGSGLYREADKSNIFSKWRWKNNRKEEFKGSLTHFLIALYNGELGENGYIIRETWGSVDEINIGTIPGNTVAQIRSTEMDSLFDWDPDNKLAKYLYFFPNLNIDINKDVRDLNEVPPRKSLAINERMIVYFDKYGDGLPRYMQVIKFYLMKNQESGLDPELLFNSRGQYEVRNGSVQWSYLDNNTRLIKALPSDYAPWRHR